MTDAEFYWDWLKHEQNVFNDRSNFFLTANALMLAGVAALVAADRPSGSYALQVLLSVTAALVAGGQFVTSVWLYVNATHIAVTQARLVRLSEASDSRTLKVLTSRWRPLPNNLVMGVLLPVGILVAWAAVAWHTCLYSIAIPFFIGALWSLCVWRGWGFHKPL